MLKIGIVAEGLPNSDVQIISELVKKILSTDPSFIQRSGGNRPNVIKKYRGWLEDFRNRNVDKALIIIDQDMSCVRALVEKLKGRIADRQYRFPVKFHVIEREIETWLLADERALSKVAGKNIHRVNETLEDILQPKEKLIELLFRVGVNCTAETKRRIAAESDIERIAYRCPGFRRFRQSVLDC
ncbi:MAG: DUF4276 family protein [Syntrophobacterales bacterium]|jgi:hypothetical protein|nr:DUF4276 family protein [Syntrophobacterales bacterium]